MMFGGQKRGVFLKKLKQKIRGESSLSTRLLSDVVPEVELSDYQRAPSDGIESPSGLLNGENKKAEPIVDLDLFFERIYSYYCGKGLQCIIIKWIVELLTLAFIILFSGFFLLLFNWIGIRNVKCGMDAVESGKKPCDLAKEVLHQHPLTPLTLLKVVILGYLGITSSYWIFCFLRFFVQLKDTLEIRKFYINRNFCIRKDFVTNSKTLKKTLTVAGLAMLLLSPFLVVFMLVYLFLRHAEQFYKDPSTASSRRWSNLSKWILREFNEVDHLFKHRINSSVAPASDYLKQFPSPILSIIAKFISFVSGGFTAVLIIIAFLEESLLEGHIFGRNLLWYGAVFGAITAISRAAVSDELLVVDPHGTMSLVCQHTHFMPKRWRVKQSTEFVRTEFETLFQYMGKMLLEEMASIFLTPYMLIFVIPKRADDILQFITDFTVYVEGVGHVCSFSVFDFRNHGNSKYASPHNSSSVFRSSQGKMEKSFLSFHSSYPSWEPNADGKQFLSTLKKFQEQRSPNQIQEWLINLGRKKRPYILDSYYTSHHHHHHHHHGPQDIETCVVDVEEEPVTNTWVRPDIEPNRDDFDDTWRTSFEDQIRSNLEASTSRTIIQHHDFRKLGQATQSHWWARKGTVARTGVRPEASFLEPPNFNQESYHGHRDSNLSERSFQEQDQRFGWGIKEEDYTLHFDDIYDAHSQSPPANNTFLRDLCGISDSGT